MNTLILTLSLMFSMVGARAVMACEGEEPGKPCPCKNKQGKKEKSTKDKAKPEDQKKAEPTKAEG